jgi:hypothetical protein
MGVELGLSFERKNILIHRLKFPENKAVRITFGFKSEAVTGIRRRK